MAVRQPVGGAQRLDGLAATEGTQGLLDDLDALVHGEEASAIDFFAMAYRHDIDSILGFVDRIDHPEVTHSDAPKVLFTYEFSTAGWTGIVRQLFDLLEYSRDQGFSEPFELLSSGTGRR